MPSTSKTSIVIGGTTKELEAAVDHALGKLSGMATKVVGIFAGIATLKWGNDLFNEFEKAEVGFTQMLGSADLAKQTLKEISDYASKTSFDNPTLQKAYRDLRNYSFELADIPGMMRVLANAASTMPEGMVEGMPILTGAIGRMRGHLVLSTKDMKAFADTGINAWEYLRQAIGTNSIDETMARVESGMVDSATGVQAVMQGMDKDFAKGGELAAGTVGALVDTIKFHLGRGLEGMFKGLTGGDFKAWLDDIGGAFRDFEEIGLAIGKNIAAGFQVVKNVFDAIHAVGSAIADVVSAAFDVGSLNEFSDGMATLRTDFDLVKSIAMKFIEVTSVGFGMVGDAVSKYLVDPLGVAVGFMMKAIAKIIDGLGWVLEALGNVSDTAAEWATKVNGVADSLRAAGNGAIDHAKTDFNAGPVMEKRIQEWFDKLNRGPSPGDLFTEFENTALDFAGEMDSKVLDFGKSVGQMSGLAAQAGDGLGKLASDAAQSRHMAAQKVLQDAKSPLERFKDELSDLSAMLASGDIGKDAFSEAVGKSFKGLASSAPGYSPNSAITAGSAEAQSSIIAARQGGNRVEDIMKAVESETRQTRRINEDILKQLKQSQLIPVGIN